MKNIYHIDYETYSEHPITNGSYAYAEHYSTRILMFAITRNDGEIYSWRFDQPDTTQSQVAKDLFKHAIEDENGLLYAHNYQFEHAISRYRLLKDVGINPSPITKWRCTAAIGNRVALPASLDQLSKALGNEEEKSAIGKKLIGLFSTKNTILTRNAYNHPDEGIEYNRPIVLAGEKTTLGKAFDKFVEYCIQDVEVERGIHKKLAMFALENPVNKDAEDAFLVDALMNDRGIPIDKDAVREIQNKIDEYAEHVTLKYKAITQHNPTQNAVAKVWFNGRGYPYGDLTKASRKKWAENNYKGACDQETVEAFKLFNSLSNAAVKKVAAMAKSMNSDGFIRGALKWSGAVRTHRWTGKILQPQNLKKPSFKNTEEIFADLKDPRITIEDIMFVHGYGIYEAVSSVIRNFIRPKDSTILDMDYSNIEARILLWVAGEKAKLKNYADGVDNYKVMASAIFDKPVDEIDGEERFLGKTAILGCGYGTGVSKFSTMLEMFGYQTPQHEIDKFRVKHADYIAGIDQVVREFREDFSNNKVFITTYRKSLLLRLNSNNPKRMRKVTMTDAEFIGDHAIERYLRIKLAKKAVHKYREEHPEVVKLWHEVGDASMDAVRNKGKSFSAAGGKIQFIVTPESKAGVETLLMRLPSGHCLSYPRPFIGEITKTMIDEQGVERKMTSETLQFFGKNDKSVNWGNVQTYGARLVENACQAIGGDFLAHGVVEAEKQGYETFLVVHDQALAVKNEGNTLEGFRKALTKLPSWAEDFPLEADGQETVSYTK